jgi:hypothetical protein
LRERINRKAKRRSFRISGNKNNPDTGRSCITPTRERI